MRLHFLSLAAVLAIQLPADCIRQEQPSPEAFLAGMAGTWEFTVRAASRGQIDAGVRSVSLVAPLRIDWIDRHSDGTTSSGYLLFDEATSRFEYGFEVTAEQLCTVTGSFAEFRTIRFGRDGPCASAVLESFLRMDNPGHYVFARTDLGFVAGYSRVER
jgi:hypothetical protein